MTEDQQEGGLEQPITAVEMMSRANRDPDAFGQFRKTAETTISRFTVPAGTLVDTGGEVTSHGDEPCRIAFDAGGQIYPLRESEFRSMYEPA